MPAKCVIENDLADFLVELLHSDETSDIVTEAGCGNKVLTIGLADGRIIEFRARLIQPKTNDIDLWDDAAYMVGVFNRCEGKGE